MQNEKRSFVIPGSESKPSSVDLLSGDGISEHAILQLPFTVSVDGRLYEGVSLSLVNAVVTGLADQALMAGAKLATFKLAFEGYGFSLPIEVTATQLDEETGKLQLTFSDPTGPHLAHLRYIINSYIAGEIVYIDDLLRVRDNQATSAASSGSAPEKTVLEFAKKMLGSFVVAGATIALVLIVGNQIKNRLLVTSVPALAQIVPSGVPVTAPVSGQILFFNAQADFGDPLFAIQAHDGSKMTVANPCDCKLTLTKQSAVGEVVVKGEDLAFIPHDGNAPVVKVTMSDILAKNLLFGGVAEATLPDGRVGLLDVTDLRADSSSGSGETIVSFSSSAEMFNEQDIGQMASLRILDSRYLSVSKTLSSFLSYFKSS